MVVRKKQGNVCRACHRVVDSEACTVCGSTTLTNDWAGYLVVIDPELSEMARRLNIKLAGRYALKVR
jgi:DNA-directed RNA polymerase subunit E"